MAQTLYEIKVTAANGQEKLMETYRGDVLLIVNVASKCGFTPQYEGLEALNQRFGGKGLRVLGFPCNDFGAQEPGSMEEIEQFCKVNYGVTFEVLNKVGVLGEDKHPLYEWLTTHADSQGDVKWNFEKFLITRDGAIAGRFSSNVAPDDTELVGAIEGLL